MRRFFLILPGALAIAFAQNLSAQEEFVPPTPYESSRYEPLWKKSPFTLASTEEVVNAGFADNLILVGIATIDDEAVATIVDRASSQRFRVTANPNSQGLKLLSVGDMSNALKASVRIQQGEETAEIRFDPMLIKTGPVATLPVPPPQFEQDVQPAPGTEVVTMSGGAIVPPQRTGSSRRRVIIPSQPPQPPR